MRWTREEYEMLKLTRRYVTRDRRYLKLGGALLGMGGRDRAKFMRTLGKAAGEISPRELGVLLDRGWRERGTAAWLIAVRRQNRVPGTSRRTPARQCGALRGAGLLRCPGHLRHLRRR